MKLCFSFNYICNTIIYVTKFGIYLIILVSDEEFVRSESASEQCKKCIRAFVTFVKKKGR